MQFVTQSKKYAICINNDGYPASLERRKIYEVITDLEAASHGMLRIIDESGEDYLYSASHFVLTTLPESVERALKAA
ncbi:MAG TPA: hypothetical protein VFG50_12550 [Rhodothermales bacterium]|nr:hypothetical protein [Rhodothermales bacterium]